MKKYTLRKYYRYIEKKEVIAENWEAAVKLLHEEEFKPILDPEKRHSVLIDQNIEYCGEAEGIQLDLFKGERND